MQFKRKLMDQTCENGKNPNFGPDFGLLAQLWAPKLFFAGFTSSEKLDIVPS